MKRDQYHPRTRGLFSVLTLCLLLSIGSIARAADQFHIEENGQAGGPYTIEQLRDRQQAGTLSRSTLAWKPGMDDWQPAGEIPALSSLFNASATPRPPQLGGSPGGQTGQPAAWSASRLTGEVSAYLDGDWRNSGPMPVEGYGMTDADVAMTYRPDGTLNVQGQYRVQDPGAGMVPIDVRGTGRWHATIEHRSNDTNELRSLVLDSNLDLTMTLPAHFGMGDQKESLNDSSQIHIIDENSFRDSEGVVWQRAR